MAHSNFSLLQECRDYFQRVQSSWDEYFSKWEAMAEHEDLDEELNSDAEMARQAGVSAARRLRKKSIAILSGKRLKSSEERKRKLKSVRVQRVKSRDRKRETEIIHTTENQTNLECEVVNNKHFESDLKAIFIEILSENTNKMGMFSVLSRMFSGTAETISNFSPSSMIMEKNGFSISPVNKTVLRSVSLNGFQLGGEIPARAPGHASALSCVNITESHASNAVNEIRKGHLLNVRECHITLGTATDVIPHWEPEKPVPNSGRLSTSNVVINSPASKISLSPEATLNRIIPAGSVRKKCPSEKSFMRKRVKSVLVASDDDDSEDDVKVSPGRILKISCTPKRPRKAVKSEAETTSDDDDSFRIFDRVKTEKN